ncbi:hypothetical protein OIU85_005916 [Salix viminalis]|uniref:Uncharacterized protein n=1 Tax=Salix viminalis TaxID=40686 RepID=A0A9Q0STJ2_SALVM|nr:hypothetical protein OIU85_005916 [Salix viminalis]
MFWQSRSRRVGGILRAGFCSWFVKSRRARIERAKGRHQYVGHGGFPSISPRIPVVERNIVDGVDFIAMPSVDGGGSRATLRSVWHPEFQLRARNGKKHGLWNYELEQIGDFQNSFRF